MRRIVRKVVCDTKLTCVDSKFLISIPGGLRSYAVHAGDPVENVKRRRALAGASWMEDSRHFFERVLNVKKIKELVFIPKGRVRAR